MKAKLLLLFILCGTLFIFSECSKTYTCDDLEQNGGETGIDCGDIDGNCPVCATCTDGVQNGSEEGVDCGGPWCAPCAVIPTCTDGVQNQGETGVDCGGPCAACADPTCTDGIQNGDETGVDCGGTACAACADPTCTDGIQNGDETGVDCGGTTCDPCDVGATCSDGIQNGDETGIDCGGSCVPCSVEPTCTDGVQNGDETGVDCGGATCPACEVEEAMMTALINGSDFAADAVTGTAIASDTLEIRGTVGTVQITLVHVGSFTTGTFNLAGAFYQQDAAVCSSTSGGNIGFTTFDTTNKIVSGTFNFECTDASGTIGENSITEGTFTNVTYD